MLLQRAFLLCAKDLLQINCVQGNNGDTRGSVRCTLELDRDAAVCSDLDVVAVAGNGVGAVAVVNESKCAVVINREAVCTDGQCPAVDRLIRIVRDRDDADEAGSPVVGRIEYNSAVFRNIGTVGNFGEDDIIPLE